VDVTRVIVIPGKRPRAPAGRILGTPKNTASAAENSGTSSFKPLGGRHETTPQDRGINPPIGTGHPRASRANAHGQVSGTDHRACDNGRMLDDHGTPHPPPRPPTPGKLPVEMVFGSTSCGLPPVLTKGHSCGPTTPARLRSSICSTKMAAGSTASAHDIPGNA